mgnify:CR=1 FL=1
MAKLDNTQERVHYLYRHIRLDTNTPFYIGIGTVPTKKNGSWRTFYKRAFQDKRRNDIWTNIVNKTDYRVEIMLESNDYEFIKEKEIEFIALYGRKDLKKGSLANMSKRNCKT